MSVPVTLAQSTSPPPESLPVRIRLEPAQLALVEATSAAVNVVLDNRGGHETVKFNLSGRDPGNEVGFRFEHARVAVQAGSLGYVRLVVETRPVPKGGSDNRPFSVVATADDGREIEASGSLELSSRPDAIGSAKLLRPSRAPADQGAQGNLCGRRRQPAGRRAVAGAAVRRGRVRPGPDHLQAAGAACAPGQVGAGDRLHRAPAARGWQLVDARVQFAATSAAATIGGEATFTQTGRASHRRLWAVLLVLLGAIALVIGASSGRRTTVVERRHRPRGWSTG